MTTFRSLSFVLLVFFLGCKNEQAVPAARAPAELAEKAPAAKAPDSKAPSGDRIIELKVTEEGFEPTPISVKKGEPLVLKVTRVTDKTCATEILIDGTDINVPLPLNQAVEVRYTPSKSGQIRYGCAMGMMISGVLVVE